MTTLLFPRVFNSVEFHCCGHVARKMGWTSTEAESFGFCCIKSGFILGAFTDILIVISLLVFGILGATGILSLPPAAAYTLISLGSAPPLALVIIFLVVKFKNIKSEWDKRIQQGKNLYFLYSHNIIDEENNTISRPCLEVTFKDEGRPIRGQFCDICNYNSKIDLLVLEIDKVEKRNYALSRIQSLKIV